MFLHELIDDGRLSIAVHAFIWFITLFWVFIYCKRNGLSTVGIPLCYLLLLLVIHFGALVYLLPWYDPNTDDYLRSQGVSLEEVSAGFALTVLGVVGFAVGVSFCDSLLFVRIKHSALPIRSINKFGKHLVAIGAVSFFVIFPISGRIPSGSAIATAGVNLSVVGLCLLAFNSLRTSGVDRMSVLGAAVAVPSITMLFLGFVGYGVAAVTQIFGFIACFVRVRWWHFPVACLALWFLLSFYITYMSGRDQLREVVWRGAGIMERVQVMGERLTKAELFNPLNNKHLHAVDGRLNQNALVGKSMVFMRSNNKEFANGRTLYIAAVAWIPRIVWPGKPAFGGSGSLVSEFTGMMYASGTSVGIGQVMEFYANFGQLGVFGGFAALGLVLRYIDRRAAAALRNAEYWEYTRFHLMGICALQPGGLMAEVVASSAAGWVLILVIKQYFSRQTGIFGDPTPLRSNSLRQVPRGIK